ncbi:MAG: CRISPR-associated ring nuclease Csm6 [Bacteroidetes bacterium]|nr:CRISPR-associated ring nuclease Csm6 [Bacteroidota bacterium]
MNSRNIMVSICGLTPQVITETLFCLSVKKKIPIHELYIITTKRGRDVLLGKDTGERTPKVRFYDELQKLCEHYDFPLPRFEESSEHIIVAREESIELSDVRSDHDNILFPNKLALFLREKTADPETVLYCSITGGRKSMSVHLANVLALYAREQDKLLHVLTHEEHEFKGFYPKTKKEAQFLEIAEIPFVRLRSLLSPELKKTIAKQHSYANIVGFAQRQLKLMSDTKKMVVDIERRELFYDDRSIVLEPLEFLFYYYFIDEKLRGKNRISIHEFISNTTLERFQEYCETYFPNYPVKDRKWGKGWFSKEDFRSKRSKVNAKLRELFVDEDMFKLFSIEVEKKYGESCYFIPAEKSRFLVKALLQWC